MRVWKERRAKRELKRQEIRERRKQTESDGRKKVF